MNQLEKLIDEAAQADQERRHQMARIDRDIRQIGQDITALRVHRQKLKKERVRQTRRFATKVRKALEGGVRPSDLKAAGIQI